MADEEAREELHRLEEQWMQAHQERDEARLEELVADGFRFTAIHLNPEPMTREQWMGAALGGYRSRRSRSRRWRSTCSARPP